MEIIDYDILEDIRQEQLTQTVIFRCTDEERNNILKKYGLNPDFMNDLEFQRTQ